MNLARFLNLSENFGRSTANDKESMKLIATVGNLRRCYNDIRLFQQYLRFSRVSGSFENLTDASINIKRRSFRD